jgi:hypothetical protein
MVNRGSGTLTCTVELVKKVALSGGSFDLEGDETNTVFFSIDKDDYVYVLAAAAY